MEITAITGSDFDGIQQQYWSNNKELIHAMRLPEKDKSLWTFNYMATYEEDLPAVFEMLDRLLTDPLVIDGSALNSTDNTVQ